MVIRAALSRADQERFDSYAVLFGGETDRGAAVLAGEYISSLLAHLLRAFLAESKATDALFQRYAPLSSFSARIDVASSLGLLRESTRRDLHLIRRIRNHFAHHPDRVDFAESPVRDWCLELPSTQQALKYFGTGAEALRSDSRLQFIMAVQSAMFAVNNAKYEAVHRVIPPEPS